MGFSTQLCQPRAVSTQRKPTQYTVVVSLLYHHMWDAPTAWPDCVYVYFSLLYRKHGLFYVGLLLYRCVDWVVQRGMLWYLVVFLYRRYPCHDHAMSHHWMALRSSNILMGLCEVCYMLWKQGFECSYMPHDAGVVAVVNNCSSSTTLNHAILPV